MDENDFAQRTLDEDDVEAIAIREYYELYGFFQEADSIEEPFDVTGWQAARAEFLSELPADLERYVRTNTRRYQTPMEKKYADAEDIMENFNLIGRTLRPPAERPFIKGFPHGESLRDYWRKRMGRDTWVSPHLHRQWLEFFKSNKETQGFYKKAVEHPEAGVNLPQDVTRDDAEQFIEVLAEIDILKKNMRRTSADLDEALVYWRGSSPITHQGSTEIVHKTSEEAMDKLLSIKNKYIGSLGDRRPVLSSTRALEQLREFREETGSPFLNAQ